MGAMQKLKNLFVGEDELEQEDAMYQQPVYENKTEYNEAPKNTGAYVNNARPDPSKRIEQMVTDLGLNETQAKEFKAVMEEMRPNRDASGERPSREEMEKKRNEADAKLKKIQIGRAHV